jgi:hypothetical protein
MPFLLAAGMIDLSAIQCDWRQMVEPPRFLTRRGTVRRLHSRY